jgi:hypothetical protein
MNKDCVGIVNRNTSNLDRFAGICRKERQEKDSKKEKCQKYNEKKKNTEIREINEANKRTVSY